MSEMPHSLAHAHWDGKEPVVVVPTGRRKVLDGEIRKHRGVGCQEWARQPERRLVEGHLRPDPVHRGLEIPPKDAVASLRGVLKGKRALALARQCGGKVRNLTGEHCWARGYAVSPVGCELEAVTKSIRAQEAWISMGASKD